MTDKISFGSDNYAGVCPEVMDYFNEINQGHVSGYGEDAFTEKAKTLFSKEFGSEIDVYFVYNGTGANTLSLEAMTESYNSIICSDVSHIIVHEVTGPQKWTGCKFICLPNINGKIILDQIKPVYEEGVFWGHHTALPKVVSITQPTEYGTLYSLDEIKTIANYCHQNNMLLHMDGARISNACVALNCSFKEVSKDCGVDVLSFGATKNGLMFGEAVVFFNTNLSDHFDYRQKQGLQLHSKMRFISGQFIPYLEKKVWQKNALQSNNMCKKLAFHLENTFPGCLLYAVETNQIFAKIPMNIINELHKDFHFYIYNPKEEIVRYVTSFDTKETDVYAFGENLKHLGI
jgi:threonine aldolase